VSKIDIFFASDDNFVQHLCVAIASILKSADKDDKFKFYIMTEGLSDENINHIKDLNAIKAFDLEFIIVDGKKFENYVSPSYINTNATFFRYLIPEIKPELEKVLYLDCDIVVKGSLSDLFNTDIGDNLVAGVEDPHVSCAGNKLKPLYEPDLVYLNAGVLLFNCKAMRSFNFTQKCFNANKLINLKTYWGADQDVINMITHGRKYILKPHNNLVSSFLDKAIISRYTEEEIDYAMRKPLIIHFSDRKKPWTIKYFPQNDYAFEYYKYLKLTSFYNKNTERNLLLLSNNTRIAFKNIKENKFLDVLFDFIKLPFQVLKLLLVPIENKKLIREFNRRTKI